jgi:SAM-dependent methyltransferase
MHDARAPSRVETPREGWWGQAFFEANRRFCVGYLQPRLYTVSHVSAVYWWFTKRFLGRRFDDVLEFGCGRKFLLFRLLQGHATRFWATDIEDVPQESWPTGVTFRRCTPESLPFANNQFDAVVIRSVVEHLPDPDASFRELGRILKPGGRIFMNLPNKWDYVSVAAVAAGRLKSTVLKNIVHTQFDDFPVHYRCNTVRTLRRVAGQAGFEVEHLRPLPSEPAYLTFFAPLYVLGAFYQFGVSLLCLDLLQPAFLVILRKPDLPV